MRDFKKDFPIFENNPGLIFMDSTASSQKPAFVIDGIKEYLENDYSNIHRGAYSLAERSEDLYEKSKKKVADFIGADSWREVIYTYNANYALNFIAGSLGKSEFLKKGDKVLVSIVEHHSNIVPWLILKDEIGIEIEYINVDEDFNLDLDDLRSKLDENVKIVSVTHVSNVTGQIFDLEKVGEIVKDYNKDILFIADASQSFPHFKVDVKKINCDMIFFTAHKVMADSGLGVWWAKTELLDKMKPIFSGGGAISWVKKFEYKDNNSLPEKFEVGTPNMSGAVSLLKALEYIDSIGGYEKIEEVENELIEYTVEKWKNIKEKYDIKILGSLNPKNRVGVFSFLVPGIHSIDLADALAEEDICIRAGQHCAEPFLQSENCSHTCRMSLYIYNDKNEIDRFFELLDKVINKLK
ncbi:aminotransferase class V-fold PLP-dependent enzyme [Candidatus Gracilibacteria bacterium]|nr:aminotransferase class V-fold PLP-dependent enzyme [Candidatus Gracilibacteria bacterium]